MATKTVPKLKGTIKTIKKAEGYGFITHTETGVDHFFHRSQVRSADLSFDQLEVDQGVAFTAVDGPKGPRAMDVELVD
jgi:cold shock protein